MTNKTGLDDLVAGGATRDDIEALPRSTSFVPPGPNTTVVRQFEALLGELHPGAEPAAVSRLLSRAAELLIGGDAITVATAKEIALAKVGGSNLIRPRALVDAVFSTLRGDVRADDEMAAMLVPTDPWPATVDGAALLDEIHDAITRHVVLPAPTAALASAWVVFAHAIEAAGIAPILAITSPTKRCGKTTLLSVLAAMVPKALQVSNMSASSVFRIVDKYNPTLLIDEADTFLNDNPELRGILNSGHTRRGAFVVRVEGEEREPKTFSTWCPKAIAKIGPFPSTLDDRSIIVSLRRRARGERVAKVRLDKLPDLLDPISRRASRWARDHMAVLAAYEPQMPSGLHDRAEDNLRILFAISELAGGDWPDRLRAAALNLYTNMPADADQGAIELLKDLRGVFLEEGADRLSTDVLTERLVALEHRPWATRNKGRAISAWQIAKLLRDFGVQPQVVRVGDKTPRGYLLEHLQDAFDRYLDAGASLLGGSQPATPQHVNNDVDFSSTPNRNTFRNVAESVAEKNGHNLAENNARCGVAGSRPPTESGVRPIPSGSEEFDEL